MVRSLPYDASVSYLGPPIETGPLPALFYLALSVEETLQVDPFNQPAVYLSSLPMRIFSMTLPGHGPGLDSHHAIELWAKEISQGHDIIHAFIERLSSVVDELISRHIIIADKLGIAGLSRGGFIAAHAAANISAFNTILGFAPLTRMTYAKEFEALQDHSLAQSLNLLPQTERLVGKTLRFYIGNRDTRVGTSNAFAFIEKLTDANFHHKIRSPQVELIIYPSVGHLGHGTPPPIFHQGAAWIAGKLVS
jgi:hypothetical protein